MDEMQLLGNVLTKPEPAADVVDRGRHELQQAARGRAHRQRRPVRLLAGGLIAAGTAAAVVVTAVPSGPSGAPPPQSARQILLAAAATAAVQQQVAGTYWHFVREVGEDGVTLESWMRADGTTWDRWEPGGARMVAAGNGKFWAGMLELSYRELTVLPTDPTRLEASIAKSLAGRWGGETKPSRGDVESALADLLAEFPAPREVRVAAFTALAAQPNVTSLGPVDGGQGLLIKLPPPRVVGSDRPPRKGDVRLVVDPATSQIRSVSEWSWPSVEEPVASHIVTERILVAEWTDHLPANLQRLHPVR
jgi:hypothetical protein